MAGLRPHGSLADDTVAPAAARRAAAGHGARCCGRALGPAQQPPRLLCSLTHGLWASKLALVPRRPQPAARNRDAPFFCHPAATHVPNPAQPDLRSSWSSAAVSSNGKVSRALTRHPLTSSPTAGRNSSRPVVLGMKLRSLHGRKGRGRGRGCPCGRRTSSAGRQQRRAEPAAGQAGIPCPGRGDLVAVAGGRQWALALPPHRTGTLVFLLAYLRSTRVGPLREGGAQLPEARRGWPLCSRLPAAVRKQRPDSPNPPLRRKPVCVQRGLTALGP